MAWPTPHAQIYQHIALISPVKAPDLEVNILGAMDVVPLVFSSGDQIGMQGADDHLAVLRHGGDGSSTEQQPPEAVLFIFQLPAMIAFTLCLIQRARTFTLHDEG